MKKNLAQKESIIRIPMKWGELRKPITIEDDKKWCDVWGFEGVYQINLLGHIKKTSTGEYVKQYLKSSGFDVILRHPDGDGSSLCCNLVDVWSSTFLGDKALNKYTYMDNIKRK